MGLWYLLFVLVAIGCLIAALLIILTAMVFKSFTSGTNGSNWSSNQYYQVSESYPLYI